MDSVVEDKNVKATGKIIDKGDDLCISDRLSQNGAHNKQVFLKLIYLFMEKRSIIRKKNKLQA